MLGLAVVVLALSFWLRLNDAGSVAAPGMSDSSLPSMCASRSWWGVECPGCGLTRSFIALAHGNLTESLRLHRLGWLMYLAVVLQIPYRGYKLRQLRRLSSPPASEDAIEAPRWATWFGWFLIAALIGNWVLKVAGL